MLVAGVMLDFTGVAGSCFSGHCPDPVVLVDGGKVVEVAVGVVVRVIIRDILGHEKNAITPKTMTISTTTPIVMTVLAAAYKFGQNVEGSFWFALVCATA